MAAKDKFRGNSTLLKSYCTHAEAVTPHDVNELTEVSCEIYVGGAGNITAVMADGTIGVFTAVPVGTRLPIRVKRINATGTTATLMVAIS